MSGNSKCPICKRAFAGSTERVIRLAAEVVEKGPNDGLDSDYWERVVDWALITKVHLSCAKSSILEGADFPYSNEINEIPLFDIDAVYGSDEAVKPVPILRVVEGGK